MVAAYDNLPRQVPIVIRLTGTNEDIARKIFEESDKPLVFADSIWSGARKIVELIS